MWQKNKKQKPPQPPTHKGHQPHTQSNPSNPEIYREFHNTYYIITIVYRLTTTTNQYTNTNSWAQATAAEDVEQ